MTHTHNWKLPPAHAQHIEWTLARHGQELSCHVLQLAPGEYTLRVLCGSVRFLDVRCRSLQAALYRSLEMLNTLQGRGWAPESRPA